jgi:HSP20 family protein
MNAYHYHPAFAALSNAFVQASAQRQAAACSPNAIALHVTESAEAYTVRAALPGVAKEHIGVRLDDNTVNLEVEFKAPAASEGEQIIWRDARYARTTSGKVNRQIELPQAVNAEGVKAQFDNGELILTLPKKVAAEGRSITIN